MKSPTLAVPFLWLALTLTVMLPAGALTYTGSSNQFAGGFNSSNAANGGFGGGACTATHTPMNVFTSDIFGFFPHISPGYNPKMGDGGYHDKPSGKTTQFYSLRSGYHDQIASSTISYYTGCGDTAKFDTYTNIKAQLDIGRGSTASQFDYNFSDWSIYNTAGGDADGVGHFRAKNNTGVIQRNMITTSCTGTGCCSGYGFSCQ